MAVIREKIVINAPLEKVFGFLTTPENWTRYVTSLTSVSAVTSEKLEPGTRFNWEYRMLGVKLHGTGSITEHETNRAFGMRMEGSIPLSEHYTFSTVGEGTELAAEITYEMPWKVLEMIANSAVVEKLNQKEAVNVLEKIKLLCEEL